MSRGIKETESGEYLVFPKGNMTEHAKIIRDRIATYILFVLNVIPT